ncbi:torsin-like protein [Chironomus tepperi]|uniref:torsin-like protein n=1 Tax=Chironomus tepperi TaxID=113505 RepID=UPI00391F003C
MRWVKYYIVLLIIPFGSVLCEILTASAVIGLSALGYKYSDKIYLNTYCKKFECCHPDLIPHNILALQDKLDTKLFGQHIIQEKLFKAIASHYETIEKSKKPLVMTFHGSQGTGKNYVATMIAEAIFKEGTNSKFFHLFHGSQYDNVDRTNEHKDSIRQEIYNGVDKCAYSLFVFDEVDKMPPGVFDSITALLDHHSLIKGKDFKKSIFLFLTNHGGEEMTFVLHQLTAKKGLYRHETKLHHFEEIMKVGVYNKEGGLKDSNLIKSAVIDFYFPFLPLEEPHITQCIIEEFRFCGKNEVSQQMIDEVLHQIGFNSITKYAHTGCKTIYPKVQTECYS